MKRLTDKRVRINLHPFKSSPFMLEAFQVAARDQDWSDTDITLVSNQIKGLSLDDRFEILLAYCHVFAEDSSNLIQEDIQFMLYHLGSHTHYLNEKPLSTWDEYDWSNYNSQKKKAVRRIRRVYGLFCDTVEEKDKYTVTTPPSIFYDTFEDALEAVPVGQESITNIYALWIRE